jgi:hypothetical protein|tara:strand:- start:729 stop:1154 length:426 start_codon:yes stop_codon:yes gene_type:complete
MATTASITISSDILPNYGAYTKTMTLTKAGTVTDISETTGYSRRKLASTSKVDLITMANELVEPLDNTAAKVYIKNVGNSQGIIDKSVGVKVFINSVEIGVLFGGDWLLMPVAVVDAEDIEVQPSTDDIVILEYAMYYEEG